MCGIFGIVSRESDALRDVLPRALRSLAHRGPDDAGSTTIALPPEAGKSNIGLAHTRLSIIDLSPLGHQPMHDPATGNWIVFNGEIYNFRELRKELQSAGIEFKSHSDTEVILAAYRVWGESCLTRLGGMFAFALWDAARNRLLLARDPMGIKPLYYHQTKQTFLFASEVRTLLGTGLVPRKADPTGVLAYLAFGSVYEPWTIVEGVKAVPPGHTLTLEAASLENGPVSIREYWNPLRPVASKQSEAMSENGSPAARLPAILRDAVLSHLVSDVPVGVFLSGGIDSSALVAVLSHNGVRSNTFSLVFPRNEEEEFNEAEYSRAIARHFNTEHHEIPISRRDTLAVLPEALLAMDQPTIDGINTYLVSSKTRAAGVKVALTGLGADEIFAGYSNFRDVPRMEAFSNQMSRLPGVARRPLSALTALFAGNDDRGRKLAQLVAGTSPNSGRDSAGQDSGGQHSAVHPYFLARALFAAAEREELLLAFGPRYHQSEPDLELILRDSITRSSNLDPVNRVSYLESYWYMRNTLLRDSDCMSMAHGLELRVPFLDRALVEACFNIPGHKKLQGDQPKGLLLASLGAELPEDIVNRRKRGFTLPWECWLRGEIRPLVEGALLQGNWDRTPISAGAVRDVWNRFLAAQTSWSRPWSLFVLQHWCAQNL